MEVEAIWLFILLLKTGIYLDLKETFIVPSFRRNLVFISLLDKLGYTCSFENSHFSLYLNSNIVCVGSLLGFDKSLFAQYNFFILRNLACFFMW